MPRTDRRPRYASFLTTGALVGFVVSVGLLSIFEARAGGRDRTELTILLTLLLAGAGALFGGLLALVLEGRQSARRRAVDDPASTASDP